jgi:hypothetical protein
MVSATLKAGDWSKPQYSMAVSIKNLRSSPLGNVPLQMLNPDRMLL